MKKFLIGFILFILAILTTYNNLNTKEENVLLTSEEINLYNDQIKTKTNSIYDLDNTLYSKEEILEYINSYEMPKEVLQKQMLENNLNLDNVTSINAKKAITVKRSNIRSFPTNNNYDNQDGLDTLQESEIAINTPLLILHESKDQMYYFVIFKTYYGWIAKEDVAYAIDEDLDFLTNNNHYLTITTPFLKIFDTYLDMGDKIPYIKKDNDNYLAIIPIKKDDGYVDKKEITINSKDAVIGNLPFTSENVYTQALKYLNIPYSWGSMDYGVDCSGFVNNVFKTFGFSFPRNSKDQENMNDGINLKDMTSEEKINIIKDNNPALLFMPGHVVLYLKMDNDKPIIINASLKAKKVVMEELSDDNYLLRTQKMISFAKKNT